VFASGGSDRELIVWDGRAGRGEKVLQVIESSQISIAVIQEYDQIDVRNCILVAGEWSGVIQLWI